MTIKDKAKEAKLRAELVALVVKLIHIRDTYKKNGWEAEWNEMIDEATKKYSVKLGDYENAVKL